MHTAEPDLRKRIAAIGRKNLGQPYVLNLLGEFPFEVHDDLPMFNLQQSDCVVFAEHTYAMALSRSWEEFFWMLQRIRYRDGVIGVATRNHYTEMDWNVANRWLVTDVSAALAGPNGPGYAMQVDRARFLQDAPQYRAQHSGRDQPPDAMSPKEQVAAIADQLQEGDFVNVISTRDGEYWASHVGLVVLGPNGERHLLHSQEPKVREETLRFLHRPRRRARGAQRARRQERPAPGRLQVPAPERQHRGAADGAPAPPRQLTLRRHGARQRCAPVVLFIRGPAAWPARCPPAASPALTRFRHQQIQPVRSPAARACTLSPFAHLIFQTEIY